MDYNNNVGFEASMSIEVAAKHIFKSISSVANNVKQVNLGNLVAWHFAYKQSLLECTLTCTPDYPIPWLLIIDAQIPIEFNVYGNYQVDESNVEKLSGTLCGAMKETSDFHNVRRYSNQELKKFGIG